MNQIIIFAYAAAILCGFAFLVGMWCGYELTVKSILKFLNEKRKK